MLMANASVRRAKRLVRKGLRITVRSIGLEQLFAGANRVVRRAPAVKPAVTRLREAAAPVAQEVAAPAAELLKEWQGPAPIPRAAPTRLEGKVEVRQTFYPHNLREYVDLLRSYHLASECGMPPALWKLVYAYDGPLWTEHGRKEQPPSKLVLPVLRRMAKANPWIPLHSEVEHIARLLEEVAAQAEPFRPDWAERFRLYRRELLASSPL